MPLRVTLACGATDRTLPMILGDVGPAGIDLTFLRKLAKSLLVPAECQAFVEAAVELAF